MILLILMILSIRLSKAGKIKVKELCNICHCLTQVYREIVRRAFGNITTLIYIFRFISHLCLITSKG